MKNQLLAAFRQSVVSTGRFRRKRPAQVGLPLRGGRTYGALYRSPFHALALMMCFSPALTAANYFVDAQRGDDNAPGTSARKPWRSLEKVNGAVFRPGEEVEFHRGSAWSNTHLVITAAGTQQRPIVFKSYGTGARPRIDTAGAWEDAVLLSNAQHVVVRDFEITNKGAAGSGTNTPPRRGVHIEANNAGTLTNIVVTDLFIHDVNGTQRIKHNGGLIFSTRGERIPSRFEGLRIERNIIWRVDRSGIVAQSYHARRNHWFPSLHVLIRDNWLGDIGGDGITPWATDGCVIEHNIVQGANERAGTYNAGIWPWSTDNTVMCLNRVSGVKTLLDGQGFDSDYNSHNTVIEFNLSHENDGGFLLVCTPGNRNPQENCGNPGTVARHNISRHDRARVFHVAGAAEQTRIYGNAVYVAAQEDVQLLLLSDWSGWANGLEFKDNLFSSAGIARYGHQVSRNYTTGAYGIGTGWGPATNIVFAGNRYTGRDVDAPTENGNDCAAAPKEIRFKDWPGPQFDPRHPENFSAYLKAHRKWMLQLMERQFGLRPAGKT